MSAVFFFFFFLNILLKSSISPKTSILLFQVFVFKATACSRELNFQLLQFLCSISLQNTALGIDCLLSLKTQSKSWETASHYTAKVRWHSTKGNKKNQKQNCKGRNKQKLVEKYNILTIHCFGGRRKDSFLQKT